jgi:autoinducer 2-degrading protein
VYVSVKTKTGTQQIFTEAPLKNARNSLLEPGVACFDVVLQDQQDDTTFVLVEIFKNETASAAHRGAATCNINPSTAAGWNHKNNFKYM